jgi:chorismate mutase
MADLEELRRKVDAIDDQILAALCERVKVCRAIGEEKKRRGKPVHDALREKAVYERVREKAAGLGLNEAQIEVLYREIVNMCSAVQE